MSITAEEVLQSMAQSSNYKQYSRTTRVLTEESNFSGGMLWTGNNIDATHLKTIVNCDYDDTTGFLKTRDPFVSLSNEQRTFKAAEFSVDLSKLTLIGAYNICPFNNNNVAQAAGWLYVFAGTIKGDNNTLWETSFSKNNVVCIYKDDDDVYHICKLDINNTVTLRNINRTNTLFNYENLLYGLGADTAHLTTENTPASWLQVYKLEQVVVNTVTEYHIVQLDYTNEILSKINTVTLLEACTSGFNAARGNLTFTYTSELLNSETAKPYIMGVYFKDESNNIIISPRIQHTTKIHVPVAYKTGKSTLALFKLKPNGNAVTTKDLEEIWDLIGVCESENGDFVFEYNFQTKDTVLAFAFYGTATFAESEKYTVYSEKVVDSLLPYQVTANDSGSNLKIKNYDLSQVRGNCIWRNRHCVWGIQNNNNCLFLSEIDNFYYYPIPHNVAVFNTNVMNCIPYKDTLLVFTADKIYRLSENNDGTFSQTVVQNDMPMSKEDAAYLTAIKNMVLFKSGNYFYMIVPKSQSLTDELSIAPIYKNIAGFLNTLDNSVLEVLQLLYPEDALTDCEIKNGAPSAIYAEQDTIHILYDVVVNRGLYKFKMFLNYNTNLRAWTLYLEDTTNFNFEVAALTAARLMSFVKVTAKYNESKVLEEYIFDLVAQQQFVADAPGFRVLLDTGYRTLSVSAQKRFREIQLKLHNPSEDITAFGTAFLVDGVWRRNYTKLQETLLSDNIVSLVPELNLNTFVTELTMPIDDFGNANKAPGSDAIKLSDWVLDFSHFKREAPVTVRIPVSGKGFNPRFIFMVPNAVNITINEINWVYRLMHGR